MEEIAPEEEAMVETVPEEVATVQLEEATLVAPEEEDLAPDGVLLHLQDPVVLLISGKC
jgi:hypothetical protein